MAKTPSSFKGQLQRSCRTYWHTYFEAMRLLHARLGRSSDAPLKSRNLATTDARHVAGLERFWALQLAKALGVSSSEVGTRRIRFRPDRSKSFDVCWPLTGQPKILISIKTMQNAYRNLTNRVEEAIGDSAILRLYKLPAVFGFFFFMLDGRVPRGLAPQVELSASKSSGRPARGVAPYLELLEDGGDFLQLPRRRGLWRPKSAQHRTRQDVVSLGQESLLDLLADTPATTATLHYDAIAFLPTTIRRLTRSPRAVEDWEIGFSSVDQRLDARQFIGRLIDTAKLRGFLDD